MDTVDFHSFLKYYEYTHNQYFLITYIDAITVSSLVVEKHNSLVSIA